MCWCDPLPRRRALKLMALTVGAAFAARHASARAAGPYDGPLVDVHAHLRTGIAPGIGKLMAMYDQVGIKGAWVFGDPWSLAENAYSELPARVIPLLAPGYGKSLHPESLLINPEALRETLTTRPVRGLGEVILRHAPYQLSAASGSVSNGGTDDAADDPRLIEAFRIAGEFDVVVNVHQEGNFSEELSRALVAAPDTTFIWAHAGHSRVSRIPGMLEQHPNLTIDLSACSPWLGPATVMTRSDGSLAPEWSEILHRFPDRILLGLDLFVKQHFALDWISQMTGYYRGILGQLDPGVAALIGYRNAERLAPFPSPS